MEYLKQYLQKHNPALIPALLEGLDIANTGYQLRFNFAALSIRELVRVCYQTHGFKKSEAAQTARTDFKWLPENCFYSNGKREFLTKRGELLLSLYRHRLPDHFPSETQKNIEALSQELVKELEKLSDLVHSIEPGGVDNQQGKAILDKVIDAADAIFKIKLTLLDIIHGGTYTNTATLSSSLVSGSYKRVAAQS